MSTAEIHRHLHFSLPIYEIALPLFAENESETVQLLKDLRDYDKGLNKSNAGGWHSSAYLHHNDAPCIERLLAQIYRLSLLCLTREEKIPKHNRLVISACWANINESGDWNAPHAHRGSDWAGVCYVKSTTVSHLEKRSENDGKLLFITPVPFGPQFNTPPTIGFTPKAGNMFLFPGHLLHMVAPHFSNDSRISIAFNFNLRPTKPIIDNDYYLQTDEPA